MILLGLNLIKSGIINTRVTGKRYHKVGHGYWLTPEIRAFIIVKTRMVSFILINIPLK